MAGYVINITVACIIGLIFIMLGIHQCKSESPVTMNTGEKPLKPEQLSDVKAWNTGHGKALIAFGIAIALTVSIFSIILNDSNVKPVTVAFIIVIAAEIAGLEINHSRLEHIYKVK